MILSVVMPVGRVDDFLHQALRSLDEQSFREFELVVVCNSNIFDSVVDLLNSGCFNFPYRVLHTALPGVAFAANLAIASCNSDFIARWDSDDLCSSNRFKCQIDTFNKNSEIYVIGTSVDIIDENNNINPHQKFKFFLDDDSIRFALKFRQPLLHSSLMFRSKVLFENKGYLFGHASEDHELFIRIARDKSVKFMNLPNVTTYYRRHSLQLSDYSSMDRHFYEIAGFMFSEFLRTLNPLYLVGICANIPFFRKFRYLYRSFLGKFKQ
jgi:glycosyltransferase involved in cell wall biosynthesis